MRGGTVVAAVLMAGTAAATMGGATASAKAIPHVDGESWHTAQGVLKAAGFTASVAATTGDREKWPDCEVTEVRQAAERGGTTNLTVALNCDAKPVR